MSKITNEHRRIIRQLIRESILEEKHINQKNDLTIQEYRSRHERMIIEGHSVGSANQILLEVDFLNALGLGSISGFKQQFVTSVLKDLGIPTNTLSGKFLVNLIENIGFAQILTFVGAGEDDCAAITDLLMKAAIETITEFGAAKLIAFVFEKTAGKTSTVASGEIEKAMNSVIGAVGVEVVNEIIYNYFKVAMLDDIAQKICTEGIFSFISSVKNPKKAISTGAALSAVDAIEVDKMLSGAGEAGKKLADIGGDPLANLYGG